MIREEIVKPSIITQVLTFFLKFLKLKNNLIRHSLLKPSRGRKILDERKFSREIKVESFDIDGFQGLTLYKDRSYRKHLYFLHGGAYTVEAMKGHKKLIEKFVTHYDLKCTYFDYPLSPEFTATFTHKLVHEAFNRITVNFPEDEFILFGDSAGGGLALSFLQTLRDKKSTCLPQKSILFSPWLDISLSNPQIQLYEDREVILDVSTLKYCGKRYSGNLDLKNPLVSPIFGQMENLGQIQLFVGGNEIFLPDCFILEEKINSAKGSSIILSVKENMFHDWIIFPIPESEVSFLKMIQFIFDEERSENKS